MKVYVFKSLPPFLVGYTRDIRAMWALEECGIPYAAIGFDCGRRGLESDASFEAISPFNQVPVIDDDGFVLTESGAIVLYLAEKSGKLMPRDLQGRAQVQRWCFTALNNVELLTLPIFLGEKSWHLEMLPRFLTPIDRCVEQHAYLTGTEFTVADILMTGVLREIRKTELLRPYAHLENYRRRCEERPAFRKVLDAYEDRLGVARGSAR
jgi:glutathione S-transferase